MRVYVEAVGLLGPGLSGWACSVPVLAGASAYVPAPVVVPPAVLLPANERRRAPLITRIALALGAEIFAGAAYDAKDTPAIFASSGGDGETIHAILDTLASPAPELSPTRFHNSVHNAAAGYWSIATGATAPATSLCAYDGSFAAGLLEAAAEVADGRAAALIAYDAPYPEPLLAARPIGAAFGVALLLAPAPSAATLARLEIGLRQGEAPAMALPPALEVLRQTVPAARGLPLLAALARRRVAQVAVDYLPGTWLAVEVVP
jgi:hypothetical protein